MSPKGWKVLKRDLSYKGNSEGRRTVCCSVLLEQRMVTIDEADEVGSHPKS